MHGKEVKKKLHLENVWNPLRICVFVDMKDETTSYNDTLPITLNWLFSIYVMNHTQPRALVNRGYLVFIVPSRATHLH